ncbi:glycosyltransferase family 9 protein [Actinokineospora guangxiensis]|uniref:Glycosyltransferase family 9 protein n=1 Tax=Actinokineospora guangxiensis TaxID=1490288 RepID=A0ABW0EQ97_9PSEU
MTPERVCVFAHLREPGLGDLIQRNIFLALLRRAFPAADVVLVVGEHIAQRHAGYFAAHSYATRVLRCPPGHDAGGPGWAEFTADLRAESFDLCVLDPDSHGLDSRVAARCGIPSRLGFPRGETTDPWLTVPVRIARPLFGLPDLYEYASGLARAIGLPALRPSEVVPPLPRQPEPSAPAERPQVAVHPGGAKHWNRRWPAASYALLCVELAKAADLDLILIGSADEEDELAGLTARIRSDLPGARVRTECGGSLNHLADVVAAADVLVGNDSAPAHIAAAVRTPSVVLYGPTMTEFMWARAYPRQTGINLRYECQMVRNMPRGEGPVTMPCAHRCHYPYVAEDGPYPRCLSDIAVATVVDAVRRSLPER